jgi:RimJ/RimL family protein N-acetyltransferase
MVSLRPFEQTHLDAARAWVNDPAVARGLHRVLPVTALEQAQWYEALVTDRSQVVFSVEAGGQHVGVCGLKGIDMRLRAGELWMYVGPGYQGQGIGTAACKALCAFGFDALALHRVWLHVLAENLRAIACYRSCGFEQEGRLRDAAWVEGMWAEMVIMGLLNRVDK